MEIVEPVNPVVLDAVLEDPSPGSENDASNVATNDEIGQSDRMYDRAVEVVQKNQRASMSLLQRHLSVGYNKAASLLESMEKAGLVSAMNARGQREVLVPRLAE